MANTRLNFDINFRTRGNFGPLTQGLNQVRAQSTAAFGAMTTPAIRTRSAIDGLASSLERKRLGLSQTRIALRNTSAVLKEHNALLNASAISYKNATGAGKTYLTINRAMTGSVATLNQRLRFTVTVLNAASTSLINFGKNVQWAGRQVMMGLTLPLLLIGSAASKAAEDLDRQLVRIVKVTNVSTYKLANEFGELGKSMRSAFDVGDASAEAAERVAIIGSLIREQSMRLAEFGASLGFVAEQSGKVGAEFAQMGFQGFQLDALTKSAMTLSRVSGTDLNESVQLVRLTVQAFGNDIASLEEKFARLNLIENNTALSLAEMAQGIPIVASVADNLGISIENLGGMLAIMKEKGIAAREGATALRTGLIQLIQKPTKNAVEAFEMINLNLNEMQERNRGDIIGFFNELANTMNDLSGSGRQGQANLEMFTQALATLTGVRASARFLSLISEMGDLEKVFDEETQQEVWKVKEGVDANSVAARAFINTIYDAETAINIYKYELDQVNNSLSGVRDRLKAELNIELAKMGEAFLRVGNIIREAINNVLRSFNQLSDRTQNIVFAFGTFIAVLGPLTMFMGIFANAIGQIAKGITSLLPKMKLMTAAQVAEARAQEITNQGLAISLAMKEDMIGTNMRLMASTHALNTANVLSAHGMFGVAPLPMSIRPGASAAQQSSAAMGVLSAANAKKLRNWQNYQAATAAGTVSGSAPPPAPSTALIQSGRSSRVAGTAAASALLAPNILKMLPGADLGLMGTSLRGGSGSIAQLVQQELERDLLRTRNALISSGTIGGPRVKGAALDAQFGKHLKTSGYDANRRAQEMLMLGSATGKLGGQAVDPSFLRAAAGFAPAMMAGTVVSGQAVRSVGSGTKLGSRGMADVFHNERLFRLAEMQKVQAPVAAQLKDQTNLLRREAQALRLSAAAADDYVRQNMPRTLPAAVQPSPIRQAAAPTVRTATRRTATTIPRTPLPALSSPAVPAAAAASGTGSRVRSRPSLLQIKSRTGGLGGREMRLGGPLMDSPLARYTRSGVGSFGTGRIGQAAATGAAGVGRAGGALVRSAVRAEHLISDAFYVAGREVSRNIRNAATVAGTTIANAASTGYATAGNVASRGRARASQALATSTAAISTRSRRGVASARAAMFRGFEGITGQTGGLPQSVSRSALNASREAALASEFSQLEQMGRAPEGMNQQQYISSGMQKQKGVRGRTREIRSAMKGAQGPQTTSFLKGVQRGSQGAGALNKAVMATMLAPIKAPFKAIGKLGTVAGKGLSKVAKSSGFLGKALGPLAKMGLGGMAKGAMGVALGAGLKLALPLTIIFGGLAITNKDEFMSGLMSTLQAPLDRLRSAWDSLTERFQYLIFLFRNMRGDGTGAFASIATTIGRVVGFVGGILMDALTSVMTIIQSVFKFIEGILKFFSGDMKGAMEAFGDAFKLLGIAILEVILNIADTLVGWLPVLDKVIGRAKSVVAGWRENITAVSDIERALIEVDNTIRTISKASGSMEEQFEDSRRAVERMAELEIIPMDKIDELTQKVSDWKLDPLQDLDPQLDELAVRIAGLESELAGVPPQIMDAIFLYIEQNILLEQTNEILKEQEEIKQRLLGETINMTDAEAEELENLRQATSEMEAQAQVLEAIRRGDGEVDPLFGSEWTEEMKTAAQELIDAGLIFEKDAGGWLTSQEFGIREGLAQSQVNDFLSTYKRLSDERQALESRTLAGLIDQDHQLELQEQRLQSNLEYQKMELENIELRIISQGESAEQNEDYLAQLAIVTGLEAEIGALIKERGDIEDLVNKSKIKGDEIAANAARYQEKERHLETLRNYQEEAKARVRSLAGADPEVYRMALAAERSISAQIAQGERELNSLREQGVVLENDKADALTTALERLTEFRREQSEALATRRSMLEDDPAEGLGDNAEQSASNVASAFKSAMGDVIGQIATAFNSVISEQTKKVTDHFSKIKSAATEYFDEYLENLSEQTKEILEQIEQREKAEEDAINTVADLRIQSIEDQADAEAKLDEERERFFRREQARVDYVRSRATADIQIREALLKGERGQAAILRIEQEAAAQKFYSDILREREDDLRSLREDAREKEIAAIEDERTAALKANEERAFIEKAAVENTKDNAEEAAKAAKERAEKEIEFAEKAAEEATELEKYRIEQYLKEWQAVTPATEEEFQKHLGELQKFFDQSNNRLRSEINRIYADFSVVFGSMSQEFKDTNNSLMNTLRDRLGSVESQYINTNNNILGAIHSTNVEMVNSIEDILNNVGQSATTTETILGTARDAFKTSIVGMLGELSMASGETLVDFTENFVPEFTGNMDWAFGEVETIADEFSKRFGNDLEAGFETATDRAIAALTEEQKWKEAENTIAAYMANIAKHLNITIPGPGGGEDSGGNGSDGDPHPFPGNLTVGSRGADVKKLQKGLNSILSASGMSTISEDGIFGPRTGSAVLAVKQRIGYPLSGGHVVNEGFWNALKPKFHSGGLVSGAGDEISAMLQPGEYVINRKAVGRLGVDFLDKINSVQAKFSSPRGVSGTLRGASGSVSNSTTNTYNLSFQVDGGSIDEQKLAQKVVFEIKKMERDMGGGRRVS